MQPSVSHNHDEETPEAKARWFQSLTLSERMDIFCFYTDLVLENNPNIVEKKRDVKSTSGRVRVLSKS